MKHVNPEIEKPGIWNYLRSLGEPRLYEAENVRDFLENKGQIPGTKAWFPLSLVTERNTAVHFPHANYQLVNPSNYWFGRISDKTGSLEVETDPWSVRRGDFEQLDAAVQKGQVILRGPVIEYSPNFRMPFLVQIDEATPCFGSQEKR